MFNLGQRAAVRNAFQLAGYEGEIRTLPQASGDEVCFVLHQPDLLGLGDLVALEQLLGQVLGRKVWLLSSVEDATVAFE